jgi:microcystin-dependent protein
VPTLDSTARLTTSQLPTTASAYPTLNQNTTGSAARWATARTVSLTGDVSYTSGSLDGSANVTGAATVVALQGNAVGNAAPADGNVLTWVAADARWEPKAGPPVPPGTIAMYAGSAAPSGWLLCDGSSYSTTTYANLYGAIGTTYGSGSGTFKVPNMQCRFPLGAGSSTGLTTRTLGATGGEEAHTLTTAELPAHTHTQTQVWYTSGSFSTVAVGGPYPLDAGPRDTQSTGGGAAHNTVPPFLVLSFIIKT